MDIGFADKTCQEAQYQDGVLATEELFLQRYPHPSDEVSDFLRLSGRALVQSTLRAVQTIRQNFVVQWVGWTELFETGVFASLLPEPHAHEAVVVTLMS